MNLVQTPLYRYPRPQIVTPAPCWTLSATGRFCRAPGASWTFHTWAISGGGMGECSDENPLRCDQSKSQGVTNSKDMAMVMAQNPGARMVPQVIAGEWMLIPPGFDPSQKCQGARSIWAWCIPSPDDSYGNGWNWQR